MRRFMVGSISNSDNKIATNLGSKTATDNRTATGVISATGSHLITYLTPLIVWQWKD